MDRNPLTARINFYISAFFVGSFALFMTTYVIDALHEDNPITDIVAHAAEVQASE